MALTSLSTVDAARPEIWAKDLLIAAEKRMFWSVYEGPQGSGMPIIRKDELTKMPGDTIRVITMSNLTGAGQTSDTAEITGNEEALSIGEIVANLGIKAHGVKFTKYADKQSVIDLRTAAMGRLSYWIADKMDQSMFVEIVGNATNVLYANDATAIGNLNAGDEMSTTFLDEIKTELTNNRALPIKIDNGDEYFVVVIHPFDAYNLRQDTKWTQAQREANVRGMDNPIFTGAMGVWNGMIVRVSQNVPNSNVNATTGAENGIGTGTVSTSICIAFGGEVAVRAYGQYPTFLEEWKDYGRQHGVGTDVVFGDEIGPAENCVLAYTFAANPN